MQLSFKKPLHECFFFLPLFHQRAGIKASTRLLQTSLHLFTLPILVKTIFFSFRYFLTLSIQIIPSPCKSVLVSCQGVGVGLRRRSNLCCIKLYWLIQYNYTTVLYLYRGIELYLAGPATSNILFPNCRYMYIVCSIYNFHFFYKCIHPVIQLTFPSLIQLPV